jgi:hypothetical protein
VSCKGHAINRGLSYDIISRTLELENSINLRLSSENRKTSTCKREKHVGRVYFYGIVYVCMPAHIYVNQVNLIKKIKYPMNLRVYY